MYLLLFFFITPYVICYNDYQTVPLRFDANLNYIRKFRDINFINLINNISSSSNLTLHGFSSHLMFFSSNKTNQCEEDLITIAEGILNTDLWALKTFDAWGKPLPSGILKGNTYWIGDYDECLTLMYLPANKTFISQPFDTQYCSLHSISSTAPNGIVLGLCVPSSCSHKDVISLIRTIFKRDNITDDNLLCSNDPANGQKHLTNGAITSIVIISLLALIVLVGTMVDLSLIIKQYIYNHISMDMNGYNHLMVNNAVLLANGTPHLSEKSIDSETDYLSLIAQFSALKSFSHIFTIKQNNDNQSYGFINGIRVLSLFWVIIGHSLLFGISFAINPVDVSVWTRNIAIQLIMSAVFSVDTFFVLSGFLTSILFVRRVEKEKQISARFMILYYVHRYIRLTPTFLFVVMVSINLTPYFGSGPVYPTQQGFEVPKCRSEYWWTSILYIGNLVKPDYMCLPIAWYLHNDMQFHWIAPLCLIPFTLGRKSIAFIVSFLYIIIGIGSITGLLIYYPGLQQSYNGLTPQTGPTYFDAIYITPWCRMSAYFVGVLTGLIFLNTGHVCRIKTRLLIINSLIAITLALLCIFGLYPNNILENGIDRISFILYQSLSRTCWSLSIGWLLFSCITNQYKIINKILSCQIWIPLARLNYSTYLIHLTIIFLILTNQKSLLYYQPSLVISNFVVHIFFSYAAALLLFILVERPFFILEKHLIKH